MQKLCQYFGDCGGCRYQDIDYGKQLIIKKERLIKALEKYDVDYPAGKIKDVIASPRIYNYRNKMEFTFYAEEDGSISCGLHRRGIKNKVLEIEECLLAESVYVDILAATLRYGRNNNLTAYHRYRHKGLLRHLMIRDAKDSKEIMVNLVTSSQGSLDGDKYVEYIKKAVKEPYTLKSLYHTINDSLGDAINADKQNLLYGDAYIREQVGDITYLISAESFFQTNPYALKILYDKAEELIAPDKGDRILDLFAGSGGVGLYIADKVTKVFGVESNPKSIRDGLMCAKINNIDNIEFITKEVKKALHIHKEDWQSKFNKAVIDPPRAGISKKIFERLIDLAIPRIAYISCNPESLAQNLGYFQERDYLIKDIQPVDMFPHTLHIETLALLEKV